MQLIQKVKTWRAVRGIQTSPCCVLCILATCILATISKAWRWVRSLIHVNALATWSFALAQLRYRKISSAFLQHSFSVMLTCRSDVIFFFFFFLRIIPLYVLWWRRLDYANLFSFFRGRRNQLLDWTLPEKFPSPPKNTSILWDFHFGILQKFSSYCSHPDFSCLTILWPLCLWAMSGWQVVGAVLTSFILYIVLERTVLCLVFGWALDWKSDNGPILLLITFLHLNV